MALKTNWTIQNEGPIIEIVDGNLATVCILDREESNSVSNATLIAAAPLLLGHLKKCLEHGLTEHPDHCISETVDAAQSLIELLDAEA